MNQEHKGRKYLEEIRLLQPNKNSPLSIAAEVDRIIHQLCQRDKPITLRRIQRRSPEQGGDDAA